jgi:hypothetical protein
MTTYSNGRIVIDGTGDVFRTFYEPGAVFAIWERKNDAQRGGVVSLAHKNEDAALKAGRKRSIEKPLLEARVKRERTNTDPDTPVLISRRLFALGDTNRRACTRLVFPAMTPKRLLFIRYPLGIWCQLRLSSAGS